MKTEFISIVGTSRSGTSLMRSILNSSEEVGIAYENHFLGHLLPREGARYKFRKFGDLRCDGNVSSLVDYIYSGRFASDSVFRDASRHWVWIVKNVPKKDFAEMILKSDRSERSLFRISIKVYADLHGKTIFGEKTPIHVRYVQKLFEWFPQGKVIHMIRDPRAVFVSELRRRKNRPTTIPYRQLYSSQYLLKLFILLQTTIVWNQSVMQSMQNKTRYSNNYHVLRFEDLVTYPESSIRGVCDFLGIKFHQNLTKQEVISDGFRSGKIGFDRRAAMRWRRHIDPWANSWFIFCFRKQLKKYGFINE